MKHKYLTLLLILTCVLMVTQDTTIEGWCPNPPKMGGTPPPPPPPADATPAPTPPTNIPKVRRAPTPGPIITRPSLGVGLMPLIQSILALSGVAEPWEVWWTRNRDKYLSFREPIEWVSIVDQGGTKSFSIYPIYDELLQTLIENISHKDHYVAFRAAISLGKAQDSQDTATSSPKAVSELKKAHEAETRDFVKNNILFGLGLSTEKSISDVIKDALRNKKDNSPLRRSYAALALGYITDDPEAPKILQEILAAEKDDMEVKSSACIALGNLKNAEAVAVLGKILNGDGASKKETGSLRAHAALGLGRIGTKEALAELKKVAQTKEKEQNLISAVVMALGMTGLPEAKDKITEFLQDKTPSIKGMACVALAQIKDSKSYETISEMFQKNKSPEADGLMLIALGLTGHEKAKADLRKILADNKKARNLLRSAAAIGLGLLKDKEALPIIADILIEKKYQSDAALAPYLILSLAMISDPKAAEAFEREGADKEAVRKKEIAEAEKQALEALQNLWAKTDKNLTVTAYTNLAVALTRMGKRKEVIEQLTKHISGNEKTLATHALHALGLVGDRNSAKALVEAAKDTNLEVRQAAMTGIGFMMDKNLINPINKITADNLDIQMVIMEHILPIPVQ